jgi:hypothetical protein
MYHEKVVRKRLDRLTDQIRATENPFFEFHDYPVEYCAEMCKRIASIFDPTKKQLIRPMTVEEEAFITHELARCKADAMYWVRRYAFIKTKEQTLVRIVPFEAQEILLKHIANAELDAVRGLTGDGIVLAVLKARQLGASTLTEALITHRAIFYANTTALVAGDVESQSAYLFDMLERIYENLPWWMKPTKDHHVKDTEMYFSDLDSLILVESGKSVRGGATHGQARGQMGRGKTYPLAHLSEISTWDNPGQIDDSLMPAIPRHPRTLAIFESTARGRGNEWHRMWIAAKKGLGRRRPVFIPWYAETSTYTRPAPDNWQPSDIALQHAEKVHEQSPKWCGKSVILSRDQLYWWEMERADHIERRKLHVFLAEYTADDMEAFQNTTLSAFSPELLHEMQQKARNPETVADIRVRTELRA